VRSVTHTRFLHAFLPNYSTATKDLANPASLCSLLRPYY